MASCRAAWLLVVALAAGCGGRTVPASCRELELRARPVVTRLRGCPGGENAELLERAGCQR